MKEPKYEVIIRFSNTAIPDVSIPISNPQTTKTSTIRKTIRNLTNNSTKNKRLRLIYSGKVLTDQTNFNKEIFEPRWKIETLASSSSPSEPSGEESSNSQNHSIKIYIHCLIGDELTAAELAIEDKLDKQQEVSTEPAPIGFDRLLNAGFSPQEVQELRSQFTALYGDLNSRSGAGDGEENNDIRQLEERWIDSTVNNEIDEFNNLNSNISNNNEIFGENEDLLIGLLVGCMLGLLGLFLLKDDFLFTKKQKMAIVAGVVVNYAFGFVRQWT